MREYRINPTGNVHFADRCSLDVCRPVAVIDYADTEQVERLHILWVDRRNEWQHQTGDGTGSALEFLTDALREFAAPKPPKPEEPKGRYASVLDRNRFEWVRLRSLDPDIWPVWGLMLAGGEAREWRKYDAIDVIRVLSEGVTGE